MSLRDYIDPNQHLVTDINKQYVSAKDFRVVEVFKSLQGESKYVGVPSIFVRLFGCTLQCPGFGMPPGEKSQQRFNVDPTKFDKFEDLPLVTTGCDSYAAWDPKFKKFAKWHSTKDLASEIESHLGKSRWKNCHLIFTGGEPLMLGWQKKLPDLLDNLPGVKNITFETNCTVPLSEQLSDYFESRFDRRNVLFSMSAKLPTSGHSFDETIFPDVIRSFEKFDRAFKFVIQDRSGVDQVKKALEIYRDAAINVPVWLMAVGGTSDELNKYRREVAELALENDWNFTDRLHTTIWGNQWGV